MAYKHTNSKGVTYYLNSKDVTLRGGLASACLLAKDGHTVTVLEKNPDFGGRSGQFSDEGYKFSYGPSWYLMPEVFDRFYKLLGKDIGQELNLKKLNPSFRVFSIGSLLRPTDIFSDLGQNVEGFERIEPGTGQLLKQYLRQVGMDYNLAFDKFIYRNYETKRELISLNELANFRALKPHTKLHPSIEKYFKNSRLQQVLELPALFLGGSPFNIPATYGLINHSLLNQGVFYPEGGMYKVVDSLIKIGRGLGVEFMDNSRVKRINVSGRKVSSVRLESGDSLDADAVISNAGVAQTELKLLQKQARSYSTRTLGRKKYSPSAVLLYLGVKGDLPELAHHNILIQPNQRDYFKQLEKASRFPTDPAIYLCNASQDDPSLAPAGHQTLYVIIPVANHIPYTENGLERFVDKCLDIIAKTTHIDDLKPRIVYKKIFEPKDFAERYGAYKNTMLGLSHTYWQTGPFRAQNTSKKVENLYYVGADTVPGIGVPMCLISAELVAKKLTF